MLVKLKRENAVLFPFKIIQDSICKSYIDIYLHIFKTFSIAYYQNNKTLKDDLASIIVEESATDFNMKQFNCV